MADTKVKKKQSKRATTITFKQRAVAKELIENAKREKPLNRSQILEKVGYAKTLVRAAPSKVFNSEGVQAAMMEAGATPDMLAKTVREAMTAEQGQWFHGEYMQHDAPDHRVRLNAASLLADIVGAKKITIENHNVNVNLSSEDVVGDLGL